MKTIWTKVKEKQPRIHNITNYVTATDVANTVLAIGGKPIMADELLEVKDIQHCCHGLNINMGTPNVQRIKTMFEAGKQANKDHHPVILDPVGVGASPFRIQSLKEMMNGIHFDVIKGNISEIKTIVFGIKMTTGVDECKEDHLTKDNLDEFIPVFQQYARQLNSIIVITGHIDLVLDGKTCYVIYNGHEMMSTYTGGGCQLSGLISCFISSAPECMLEACALAVMTYDIAGEKAYELLNEDEGNVTYKNKVIDALSYMTYEDIEGRMNYEIR